ncbi:MULTISPECIES: threonine-phosphate decarboxylase CobD [unclassified Chelatococcus]|uniref:threonine-phosphate decarboxylase CobD n=1 Tax=unclassified Chelatococcus TaxID=2638111 RepID=UPI001BCE46B4|nr:MULTISPECIES: threonine-phosphate decarboxylase CobD [unclassified Chelatococcus]MBS7698101.1 threonine-phosphate decarboxylase [Chelatococcus sp. YT9]MBX3556581.1 threonine-phosphate decarboxylase [Chelatococcus sp.]
MSGYAGISPVLHGGDLGAASRTFPQARQPWVDLSTGINPVSYPIPALPPAVWTRLPEPAELDALEKAAVVAYRATAGTHVVAGPGSQALIQRIPWLLSPRRVAVLGPTYGGHAPAWTAAGHSVEIVSSLAHHRDAAVVVLTNPNNPDGRSLSAETLAEVEAQLGPTGLLVIDEAFADVMPDVSFADRLAGRRRALVLRSFGKFFGLAGVRLGFALTSDDDLARRLRDHLGAWPVSGAAIAIGQTALADTNWHVAMRAALAAATRRLDDLLGRAGLAVVGGTTLFRLVRNDAAEQWYRMLGESGIIVRRFPEEPLHLRFGLPGTEPEWARLAAALDSCA